MSYHKNFSTLDNEALSYMPIPFFDNCQRDYTPFNKKLDLNLYCIKHPKNTCFIRVTDNNMLAWGIEINDMLVVEKRESLSLGDLLVLEQNNEFHLYELISYQDKQFFFLALNSNLNNIRTENWQSLPIVGTVTNTIHQLKPKNTMRFAA